MLLAALAGAATATAQAATLASSAGIVVAAGAISVVRGPGTDLSSGLHLVATENAGTVVLDYGQRADSTAVSLGFAYTCDALSATQAAIDSTTRHEFYALRPIDGQFVISWTPTATGTGTAVFAFDLGDDGTNEATGSAVIPFTLPAGLTIASVRLTTAASAGVIQGPWGSRLSYHGTVAGTLSIRFEATPAQTSPFGSGCGAVALDAVANLYGAVDLVARWPTDTDLAIAALGFDRSAVPLPVAPGCSLLLTPVVLLWQNVDRRAARWTIALPGGSGAVSFTAQVVGLEVAAAQVTTSAGLAIVCP
ncbi:MAG: hypothetical protein KDC98_06310 [Planctomycetes bacterium]|nr:hypothetical protein [Planctomycetota bacterium]